jgi:adenine phosphoribosyltransferase
MKPYLSLIDMNTQGRCDVTPLFADREAFSQLADDLAKPFLGLDIDAVVAIDALGFILGTAIAERLGVGLVPARKGGKLPVETIRETFVDYTGEEKALEIRPDALKPGAAVLIADEWIETGAQVSAAIALVERAGARVAGIAAINIDRCPATAALRSQYAVRSVWEDA